MSTPKRNLDNRVSLRVKIPPVIMGIGMLVWRFVSWVANVDFLFSLQKGTLSSTLQFLMVEGWWIALILAVVWFVLAGKVMKFRNRSVQIQTLAAACFVSFLFGILITARNTTPALQVFSEWGSEPADCFVKTMTYRLQNFSEKYEMALVCLYDDGAIDKYKNTSIAKSSLFRIEDTEIRAPFSGSMALRAATRGGDMWHFLVLLPKGASMDKITCLDDVQKAKGKILSQD